MQTIRLLHMYPNMLDLYGDSGNVEIIKYRCKMRGIELEVSSHVIGDSAADFSQYDIVYLGGGADLEQQILADDLLRCKDAIHDAYKSGTFFLMICGGYQLMGQYYKDSNDEKIPGLALFDYYTVASTDKGKRCIGNIVIEAELDGEKYKVIGFENHGGQTHNVTSPFGKVLAGNGNCFSGQTEGYIEKNVVATYLHGPLLSKNPKLCDHIINYVMTRKTGEKYVAQPINDKLEQECREQLFARLLK